MIPTVSPHRRPKYLLLQFLLFVFQSVSIFYSIFSIYFIFPTIKFLVISHSPIFKFVLYFMLFLQEKIELPMVFLCSFPLLIWTFGKKVNFIFIYENFIFICILTRSLQSLIFFILLPNFLLHLSIVIPIYNCTCNDKSIAVCDESYCP